MVVSADVLDAMVASGCTAEQIAAVVKADLAAQERARDEKRAKDRDRQRRSRANRHAMSHDVTVTDCDNDGHGVTPRPPCPPSFPPDPLTTPLNPPTPDSRSIDAAFARFWQAYPKREGSNPKQPAREKFGRAVRKGADPDAIVAGAEAYRRQCEDAEQIGTPYVAQAVTWLNQRRWEDYAIPDPPEVSEREYPAFAAMLADETADVAPLLRIRDDEGLEAAERFAEQNHRRTA